MITCFTRTLLGVASALFIATAPAKAAGNAIVVGQVVDLSGPNASIGRDYVAGIKTCVDMVNANGGIHGRRIQFLVRDDRGQPELAVKAVGDLIENEHIDYLFGGVGDDIAKAILDSHAFRRSGHTLFAPLANAEFDDNARVLFWRPNYKREVTHLFSHFSKLGINSVGIAYQDTPSNHEAYRSLMGEARDRNVHVVATARIDPTGDRIVQEVEKLAAARPGFVLVIADTISTALFLKEFRKRDAQRFVAGTSLVNLETLRELAGERAVEWTVFSQVVPGPNAGSTLIQIEHLNMMRKFRDEAVSAMTLEGFAAAKTLVKIIQQGKHAGRTSLQDLAAQGRSVDIGGMLLTATRGSNRLSSYVDVALFRKGSGLMF